MSVFSEARKELEKQKEKQSQSVFGEARQVIRSKYKPQLDVAKATTPNLQQMHNDLVKTITQPVKQEIQPAKKEPVRPLPQALGNNKIDTSKPTLMHNGQNVAGVSQLGKTNKQLRQEWVEDRVQRESLGGTAGKIIDPISRLIYGAVSHVSPLTQGIGQGIGLKADGPQYNPTVGTNIAEFIGQAAGPLVMPGTGATPANLFKAGQGAAQTAARAGITNQVAQRAIEGGVAGGLEGALVTGLQGGDGKDLLINTAAGVGLGAAGDVALPFVSDGVKALINKYRGKSPQEVKALLQLPAPKERGNINTAVTDDVITPEYTFGLPEADPQTANRMNNMQEGISEIKALDDEIRLWHSKYEQAINEEYEWLRESLKTRQGKTDGTMTFDADGNVTNRTGWISKNPQWYRDFHAEHNKVPNRKELYALAKKRVDEGFEDDGLTVPGWKMDNNFDETIATLEEVRNTLRQSLVELNPSLSTVDTPLKDSVLAFDNTVKQKPKQVEVLEKLDEIETPKADEVASTSPVDEKSPSAEYKLSLWERLFGNKGIGATAGSAKSGQGLSGHIVDTRIKKLPFKEKIGMMVDDVAQNNIDRYIPLKQISSKAYNMAMDVSRANNLTTRAIKNNVVDLEGNVVGEALTEVFKDVPPDMDDTAKLYLVLRDAVNRMERKIKVFEVEDKFAPKSPAEAADMAEQLQKTYPWLYDMGVKWDDFNTTFQNLWVKEGVAEQKLINKFRETNPHYVPMQRQLDETKRLRNKFSGGSGQSLSNQGGNKLYKRAKGSELKIIDPTQSMIESVNRSYNAMLRNRVGQEIYKSVSDNPDLYAGVLEFPPKNQVLPDEINELIMNTDIDKIADLINKNFDQFSKGQDQTRGEATFTVFFEGKPHVLLVKDPSLLKAIDGMAPDKVEGALKIFNTMSRGIKHSATGMLAPLHGINLALRDIPQALTQAKNKRLFAWYLVKSMAQHLSYWVPGLPKNWSSMVERYYNAGGGYEAFLGTESNVRATSKDLFKRPIISSGNAVKSTARLFKSPFAASKALGDSFENVPRIAAFNEYMRGKPNTEENIRNALNYSRDITVNWSRRGLKSSGVEALLPYSNAAIQGTYRYIQRWKEQPIAATALLGGTIGLKIASYEQFKDDPDYQNRSKFEKSLVVGKTKEGKFRTIPMDPSEVFIADLMLDLYKFARQDEHNSKTTTKERIQSGADAYLPSYLSGPLSTFTQKDKLIDIETGLSNTAGSSVIEPIAALMSGKNWYGGDIVPRDYQAKSVEEQHNETTSAPGKLAAEYLGISGFMFDYLGQKFGGDFAKVVLPATSSVGMGDFFGTTLEAAASRLKTLEDPVMKNRISNDYFELSDKVKRAKADATSDDQLPEWYNDAYNAVTSTKKGTVASDISDLNALKKNVQLDVSLSAKERAKRLREIQTQINLLRLEGIEILTELGVE